MGLVISLTRSVELANIGAQDNPFVAWENLGAAASLSGSTTITGGERANAVTSSTYDKWRATPTSGAASLVFDFGTAVNISFAALIGHNVGTLGGTVSVQNSADNVTYTDAGGGGVTPTNNRPIGWRLSTADAAKRYWRFYFTGVADTVVAANAFLGHDLVFARRFYQGFAPLLTPTEVQLQSNVSIGGELLGSSVIGRGSKISASVKNLPSTFIRSAAWLSFQEAFGEGRSFYFGWRPQKYPQDFYYCARDSEVIKPMNSGPRDLMEISFSARVYANG